MGADFEECDLEAMGLRSRDPKSLKFVHFTLKTLNPQVFTRNSQGLRTH